MFCWFVIMMHVILMELLFVVSKVAGGGVLYFVYCSSCKHEPETTLLINF